MANIAIDSVCGGLIIIYMKRQITQNKSFYIPCTMALFDKMTQPVVLKEDSDLNEQLRQLTELLQKPLSADVHEEIEEDIRCIKAGINGEEKLLFELKNSHIPMFILRDLYIEADDMSAQIDFVIISRKLFFVIECKNLYGNIEIDSSGNFIRTMQYGKRFQKTGIYSPITQNQRHLDLIRHIRQKDKNFLIQKIVQVSFDYFYRSVVVLTNPQTVLNAKKAPKEILDKVIRADQLIGYIKKEESRSIGLSDSEAEMWRFAQRFLNMHHKRNMDYTQKYLDKATSTSTATDVPVQKQLSSEDVPICSKCGAPMVKKTATRGSYTGKDFFGCSKYPACQNILNIP
jgi:hypothetical protein